jgi:hypothetical protein
VWGLKDAGKSTLLRLIHDTLAWLTGRASPLDPGMPLCVSAAAIELTRAEADEFAAFIADDIYGRYEGVELPVMGESVIVSFRGPEPERRAAREMSRCLAT